MNLAGTGDLTSDGAPHKGGYGQLIVLGDLGGGTLTVEAQFDFPVPSGVTNEWIPQDSTLGTPISITTSPVSVPFLASKCNVRIKVTGATDADVNWFVRPLPLYTLDRG